jgi:hypothetical protein
MLDHQFHVFGSFDGLERERWGDGVERRKREFFFSKPRERKSLHK